jgi:hypothetical protein
MKEPMSTSRRSVLTGIAIAPALRLAPKPAMPRSTSWR